MSEHTPLTEAKAIVDAISEDLIRMLSNAGWLDSYDARDAVIDIAPDLIAVLAAALAARTSTTTADTGLRERVEAVVREAERNPALTKNFIIGDLRAALEVFDATPASTEDRADNEGTR